MAKRLRRKLTVQLMPAFTKELDAIEQRLDRLQNGYLAELLERAIAETILAAWRTRALKNFEDTLRMEQAASGSSRPQANPIEAAKARKALMDVGEELTQAQLDGTVSKQLQKKAQKAAERFAAVFENPNGGSELSTGMFRVLALRVLELMTDTSQVSVHSKKGSIDAGVGNLVTLEKIQTPSATPLVTDHDTTSAMTTMWRQLEFGTGIYGLHGVNPAGGLKNADGTWWFGPRRGLGLHFRGSKGWGAIFDRTTSLPYQADALRFETVFGAKLSAALKG